MERSAWAGSHGPLGRHRSSRAVGRLSFDRAARPVDGECPVAQTEDGWWVPSHAELPELHRECRRLGAARAVETDLGASQAEQARRPACEKRRLTIVQRDVGGAQAQLEGFAVGRATQRKLHHLQPAHDIVAAAGRRTAHPGGLIGVIGVIGVVGVVGVVGVRGVVSPGRWSRGRRAAAVVLLAVGRLIDETQRDHREVQPHLRAPGGARTSAEEHCQPTRRGARARRGLGGGGPVETDLLHVCMHACAACMYVCRGGGPVETDLIGGGLFGAVDGQAEPRIKWRRGGAGPCTQAEPRAAQVG